MLARYVPAALLAVATVFRPTPAMLPTQRPKPRAVLTTARARWLLQLRKGARATSHGKVQQDCMAVGCTEWVKDAAGNYLEQLTPAGIEAISHLLPVKQRT